MTLDGTPYQEILLEHNRNPRNFRECEGESRNAEGLNPLCGDKLTIHVRLDGDRLADLSFTGVGCAISKSSASLMTEILKGRTWSEAKALFDTFHAMVKSDPDAPFDAEALGDLAAFSGVREYPIRVKCSELP